MKDWKTTVGGVGAAIISVLILFEMITQEQSISLNEILQLGIAFVASIIGFAAKDSDAAKVIVIFWLSSVVGFQIKEQNKVAESFDTIEMKHTEFEYLSAA